MTCRIIRIPGVYGIQCAENGKSYIGSSKSVRKRMYYHYDLLRKNKHWNRHLQKDWNLYGEAAFTRNILERCEPELLLEKELKWMEFLNSTSIEKGYNTLDAYMREGDGVIKHKKEYTKKEKGTQKGREVVAINLNDHDIKEYISLSAASIDLKISIKGIDRAVQYWSKNKKGSRSVGGYLFVYKDIYDASFDYVGHFHPISPRPPRPRKEIIKRDPTPYEQRKIRRRPIKLVGNGQELVFPSATKAVEELGLTKSKVQEALKSPETRSHRGYKFYYLDTGGTLN